jgi:hypothetical protein
MESYLSRNSRFGPLTRKSYASPGLGTTNLPLELVPKNIARFRRPSPEKQGLSECGFSSRLRLELVTRGENIPKCDGSPHGACMKPNPRGKTHTSVLSRLGFHRVRTLRSKKGLFKAESEISQRKNKGMRYFSHDSGFSIALRTNGARRLCDKRGSGVGGP